jgi:hypothetical protein
LDYDIWHSEFHAFAFWWVSSADVINSSQTPKKILSFLERSMRQGSFAEEFPVYLSIEQRIGFEEHSGDEVKFL